MSWDDVFSALIALSERLQETDDLEDAAAAAVQFAVRDLGCDHAGIVTLGQDGRSPSRLAATTPALEDLDAAEREHGGPGAAPLAEGAVVTVEDTRADRRWSGWSAEATARGLLSAHLIGMPAAAPRSMRMELFFHRPHGLDGDELAGALRAAQHVGLTLRSVDRIANLRDAMQTRALIGQAQGIVMERHGLTGEQAMLALRRKSQHSHRKVSEIAHEIVMDRPDRDAV